MHKISPLQKPYLIPSSRPGKVNTARNLIYLQRTLSSYKNWLHSSRMEQPRRFGVTWCGREVYRRGCPLALRISNYCRLSTFHSCHCRVCCSKINADNFFGSYTKRPWAPFMLWIAFLSTSWNRKIPSEEGSIRRLLTTQCAFPMLWKANFVDDTPLSCNWTGQECHRSHRGCHVQ